MLNSSCCERGGRRGQQCRKQGNDHCGFDCAGSWIDERIKLKDRGREEEKDKKRVTDKAERKETQVDNDINSTRPSIEKNLECAHVGLQAG